MSAHIDSPRAEATVTGLSVTVTVSYNTAALVSPKPEDQRTFEWNLKCSMGGMDAPTIIVPAGQNTRTFDFTMPQAGDYRVTTALVKKFSDMSEEAAGDDDQHPVHVTLGGGIIFPIPLVAPAEGEAREGEAAEDEAGKAYEAARSAEAEAAAAANVNPCDPVIRRGLFPTAPDDPTTGIVVEVYHVVDILKQGVWFSTEVTDYLAIAQMHGSGLAGTPSGAIHAYHSFSVVFPREARGGGRRLKFHRIGILGKVIAYDGGAAT